MADRVRLSHKAIEALPVPAAKRTHVYDLLTPGLAVCCTPAGGRIFYWLGRVAGHPTRIQIGSYPQVHLEAARIEAKRIGADAATGIAPRTRQKKSQQEWTLIRVFNHFLEHVSKPHKKTWERDISQFDRTLSDWNHLPLSRITKAMISAKHIAIGTADGPYAGNKMLELLKTLYGHAINQLDWVGPNPAKSVKRFAVTSRDRFLEADELPKFFKGLASLKREASRDFFALCLFTGARRVNVCSMRWSDINLERREWKIPGEQSKSDQPMTIVLSEPAMEILLRRKQSSTSNWVLPGHGSTGHFVEPKAAWKKLLEAAELKNLRIHDLRRTLGSWQAMGGSSMLLIAKSLGHNSTRATAVYARLQMDPVRESVEGATVAMMAAALRDPDFSKNVASIPTDALPVPTVAPPSSGRSAKQPNK